jgi:putative ATP-dependent endonuclease of OLD family
MFLFRAYVENMLAETFTPDSAPVLTLEEPEAHLHPQACRALWHSVLALPGQKIITTHSPYFVQNVPLKDIIILRRGNQGPKSYSIQQRFTVALPKTPAVEQAIKKHDKLLSYDEAKGEIVCGGVLDEAPFRELLMCFTGADRNEHHPALRALKTTTDKYISDDEISRLESWAKRIRGEIFFARQWIFCEGQAEYAVLGAIAEKIGKSLDAHGIALIDYQNNGAPGAFAALARALGFEWAMICDGDAGGDGHIAQLRRFSDKEIASRVIQLPRGVDLECLIVRSALRSLILAAIQELDPSVADDDSALLTFAGGHKEEVAVRLARQVRMASAPLTIPEEFTKLFQRLEGGS